MDTYVHLMGLGEDEDPNHKSKKKQNKKKVI